MLYKKSLLLAITLLASMLTIPHSAFSQFNTKFEEETFKQYREKNCSAFDLLNAINYNENLYNKGKKLIGEHIENLKSKGLQSKPLKKQIQTIYKTTHSKFLKKYEPNAFFNNIFETGQYNCVTASALYALIFDEFNINYSIRETPAHIYLIADTSGLQTLIETTLPGSGVTNFNEKFKKNYIGYLNTNKIISDIEYNNSSTDELFRKYYSRDNTISLYELAAIQYYNKGIFLMEEEKYSGSASFLSKALSVYPSNSIRYSQYAALHNALSNDINKKIFDGKLFGQVVNASMNDSSMVRLISDYFNNVSVELCINSPDINRYNIFYKDASSLCPEEKIPSSVLHKYHYFKAYNYGINGKLPLALSEVTRSYKINQDNLLVKELAQNIAIKHLFIESNYKEQIDSLEYYFSELPFLIENKIFQQQYVYYYMKVISNCFIFNDPIEGKNYYERFQLSMDKYKFENLNEDHLINGLGIMAYYFVEKNDYTTALQIAEKGLALSPKSLTLMQMKTEIENSKQRSKYNRGYDETFIPIANQSDELNEKINKHFPGKWRAVSIIIDDAERKLSAKESFEFVAEKNKKCSYTQNDKTEKGRWSYRAKSKCIYFIPDNDKDKYLVFKVKEVSADKIVLLPYKDQKKPSPYNYVLKHFN